MEDLYISIPDSDEQITRGMVYESTGASPGLLAFNVSPDHSGAARYAPVLDLPGDTPSEVSSEWLFVVGLILESGHEENFESWYNDEHLPNLAAVNGVRRAVRYRLQTSEPSRDGRFPPYLALYEVDSPEIPGNADWLTAVNTPWTEQLREHFEAQWRGAYRRRT